MREYILLITILVAFLEAATQQLRPVVPAVEMGLWASAALRSRVLRHRRRPEKCSDRPIKRTGIVTTGTEAQPLIVSDNLDEPGTPLLLDDDVIDAAAENPNAIGKVMVDQVWEEGTHPPALYPTRSGKGEKSDISEYTVNSDLGP